MTRLLLGPVLLVAWLSFVCWLVLAVPSTAPKPALQPEATATPRPTVFVFSTPTLPLVTAGPAHPHFPRYP